MKLSEEMLYEHARKAEELWLNSLPSDDKIPEHKFSNKFERKMKKLIREQRRAPWLNKFISASKRVAVVALAILTVSFSCLMCVEAYREKLIEVITDEMPQVMDGNLRMENIRTAQCSVVVEDGEVAATAKVTGSSEAEKCKIVLKIQEQQGSRWVTIGTCTVEENDYRANASNSIKAERGITYRGMTLNF